MTRRGARFVPLVFFVLAAGCGRSCGCLSGEKTYEAIDGKVKVELVRKVVWSGGKVPGPITTFVVRVHTTPPIDHVVPCDHVDLAEDDEGMNVAFRCKGAGEWDVLRLRGGDEHLYDCRAPAGTAAKPAFAKLEPVALVADRILDCDAKNTAPLVRAIAKDAGGEEAVRFVVRVVGMESGGGLSWPDAYLALGDAARARARSEICPAAADVKAPAYRWVRAVRTCPLDADGVVAAADEHFRKGLEPLRGGGARTYDVQAFEWAAALTKDGDAACKALSKLAPDDKRRRHVLSVVARINERCDADAAAKIGAPCSRTIVCDAGLCDADRVAASLAEDVRNARELDGGLRAAGVPLPDTAAAQLGALYAQGAPPKDVVRKNLRFTYAVHPAEGAGCGDDEPTGAPCVCGVSLYDPDVCALPLDGGAYELGTCVIRAVDARKRIEVTRSCGGLRNGCEKVTCCPGLHCDDRPDAGTKECLAD